MSYKASLEIKCYPTETRDAGIRNYLNEFIVGNGDFSFRTEGDYRYIEAENASFNFRGITSDIIFPDYPEYRFDKVKDFTLSHCNIKSLRGLPKEIMGNLTIENCRYTFQVFDKQEYLPFRVTGDVNLKMCPFIGQQDFIRFSEVLGKVYEEEYDDLELTEEEQQILDFASDLLPSDEYDVLEEFFYNQH